MEQTDRFATPGKAQPEEGHFKNAISFETGIGRGEDPGPSNVGRTPFEEDEVRSATANPAPETNKALPSIERLVEAGEGGGGRGGPGAEAGA